MAYNTGQAAVPRESTVTESINGRISGLMDQAVGLRSRLYSLKERALGSEPTKTDANASPKPVPNGKFNEIEIYLGDLGRLIEECHQAASQLERIA